VGVVPGGSHRWHASGFALASRPSPAGSLGWCLFNEAAVDQLIPKRNLQAIVITTRGRLLGVVRGDDAERRWPKPGLRAERQPASIRATLLTPTAHGVAIASPYVAMQSA
jgi:hypothetical protein